MSLIENIIIIAYLAALGYLGFVGYKQTKNSADYLIAGGDTHPFIMAMSYAATPPKPTITAVEIKVAP